MRTFVLDTCVFVAFLSGKEIYRKIVSDHSLDATDVGVLIPVAVKAEILSIGFQRNWGQKKYSNLEGFINKNVIIHTNDEIVKAYVEIDVFSQGKHPDKKLLMPGARNMGKNDLWIAATAYAAKATLITLDQDFNHLNKAFIDVAYYPYN